MKSHFFLIALDIAVGGLFGDGGNGAGFKDVVLAEKLFRVLMHLGLYLAGEIQVDIRLFVAVEAEEGFKRYLMSVAVEFRAALGTFFRRQVEAGSVFQAFFKELAPLAIGADIMRRKGIDLRNARHGGDKRRTDRTSGADQIAVFL